MIEKNISHTMTLPEKFLWENYSVTPGSSLYAKSLALLVQQSGKIDLANCVLHFNSFPHNQQHTLVDVSQHYNVWALATDRDLLANTFVENKTNYVGRLDGLLSEEYKGEWLDEKPAGKGTLTLTFENREDGLLSDEYDGEWLDGKPAGKGTQTFTYKNREDGLLSDKYDGEWLDGKRSGNGIRTFTFEKSERIVCVLAKSPVADTYSGTIVLPNRIPEPFQGVSWNALISKIVELRVNQQQNEPLSKRQRTT